MSTHEDRMSFSRRGRRMTMDGMPIFDGILPNQMHRFHPAVSAAALVQRSVHSIPTNRPDYFYPSFPYRGIFPGGMLMASRGVAPLAPPPLPLSGARPLTPPSLRSAEGSRLYPTLLPHFHKDRVPEMRSLFGDNVGGCVSGADSLQTDRLVRNVELERERKRGMGDGEMYGDVIRVRRDEGIDNRERKIVSRGMDEMNEDMGVKAREIVDRRLNNGERRMEDDYRRTSKREIDFEN